MVLLVISFIAGILTVLAPCILPVLPVVVGSAATNKNRWTPYRVIVALSISIVVFTYLLKASTVLITIPPFVWTYLSGSILGIFGATLLFPGIWERIPGLTRFSAFSNKAVGAGYQKQGFWGDVGIGFALGPVFSSCSPTYFVILASVLPASFALGTLYLFAYVLGLGIVLLLIALLGQRFANRLTYLANPQSRIKRGIGALFIALGILIATGYEKKIEVALLTSGFDITKLEQLLLQRIPENAPDEPKAATPINPYKEIVDPAGFLNTEAITIAELVGNKIILVDFMTYSCINCQRTFPYLVAWYEQYKDRGLEIIGIHTPEFAFEKDIRNVRRAMREFGITYPVVLDNDYATWRNYGNRYWPRKYLIDIHGNIAYDHIGEGDYEETETKIQELLQERAEYLDKQEQTQKELVSSNIPAVQTLSQSPETYFGSARNEHLANGTPGRNGEQQLVLPLPFSPNSLYLEGTWNIQPEYAESGELSRVVYLYNAKDVYLVAEADEPTPMQVLQDGNVIQTIQIQESRLYRLIEDSEPGEHFLELRTPIEGIRLYAFTFG